MGNSVVHRQFQHFRVNQDEFAGVRRELVEQRQDHRVDGDGFARTGGAGDQQVRHACQIHQNGGAADVLAERQGHLAAVAFEGIGGQQLAQPHRLPPNIGQFDTDHVPTRNHGDARRNRAHGAGNIVGEADHPGALGAGSRLKLIKRHHRAGPNLHDFATNPEIVEHRGQELGVFLERASIDGLMATRVFRRMQKIQGRKRVPIVVLEIEPVLGLLLGPPAGFHAPLLRDDDLSVARYRVGGPGGNGITRGNLGFAWREGRIPAAGQGARAKGGGGAGDLVTSADADVPEGFRAAYSSSSDGDPLGPRQAEAECPGRHTDDKACGRQHRGGQNAAQARGGRGGPLHQDASGASSEAGRQRPGFRRGNNRQGGAQQRHGRQEGQGAEPQPIRAPSPEKLPSPHHERRQWHHRRPPPPVEEKVGDIRSLPSENIRRRRAGRMIERRIGRIETEKAEKQQPRAREDREARELGRPPFEKFGGAVGKDGVNPILDNHRHDIPKPRGVFL